MKIGVFGTGMVGRNLAGRFHELGYQVAVGTRDKSVTLQRPADANSMTPQSFGEWLEEHPGIELMDLAQLASYGDVLVNALSGKGSLEYLEIAGPENMIGKTLIDVSNPLDFSHGFPPTLSIINTDSLAEQIQRLLPQTQVVKSMNTMTTALMTHPELLSEDHQVFLNGDSEEAKREVRELLGAMGWPAASIIDLGDITTARGTEQYLALWTRLYAVFKDPIFNIKILRKQD